MVAGDKIDRGKIIEEIQRLNHLFAIPQLTLKRRIQQIATVSDPDVATLCL